MKNLALPADVIMVIVAMAGLHFALRARRYPRTRAVLIALYVTALVLVATSAALHYGLHYRWGDT